MGKVVQQALPFTNTQASGLEPIAGASPAAFNIVTELGGAVRRRPGLTLWNPNQIHASGLNGVHETTAGDVYAVAAGIPRRIFRVSPTGALNLSVGALTELAGTKRPTFAETEALLVLAAGGAPQKIEFASGLSSRLGGDPPVASHVVANSARLLVNDLVSVKGSVNYSAPALGSSFTGHEQWNSADNSNSGLVQTEYRPDPVTALRDANNEVFAWGPTTLQVFGSDPQSVYAPIVSSDVGLGAPDSVVLVDGAFAWLDHRRRFVMSSGRQAQPFSEPIQSVLESLPRVSDCFGYRVHIGPYDLLLWAFPSVGRTFCFQKGAGWSEWFLWQGEWESFKVQAATELKAEGGTLATTSDGYLVKFELDGDDLGYPIRAYIETGHLNRGTDSLKHCRAVHLALRRGETTEEEIGRLYWRNDLGSWEDPVEFSLGSEQDREVVVSFYGLGSYRRRDWRFEFVGSATFSLVSATEEFEVL